jgi:hypothetical protein
MLFYLFSVEQEVRQPLPFNINLFNYVPATKKIYYIIKINNGQVFILDDNEQILSSGNLVQSENQQTNPTNPTNPTPVLKYYLTDGKLTFAGGYLNIKDNNCELIIMGSGLPYIEAYKGTLRKLVKKD